MSRFGAQSMVAPLRRVLVKRPEEAYRAPEVIAAEWEALDFQAPPDLARACAEHAALRRALAEAGAEVDCLPAAAGTTLDSIYVHDPALVTDYGAIVLRPGKPSRRGEAPAMMEAFASLGVPLLGAVEGEACAEGGDLLWLDARTLVAGRSFRTNARGVLRLRELLGPRGVEVVEVHLPVAGGPERLLHLQSIVSLLDHDLAIVQSALLPVPLFELMAARGITRLEVPGEEVEALGCNVLTLAPRRVLLLDGLPRTRARLEQAGCTVVSCPGDEIGRKGNGGPTCLTRPLRRGY